MRAKRMPLRRWLLCAAMTGAVGGAVAADDDAGRRLFTQAASPPCALCHTLADAKSEGAFGPVLDELKPDAARVAKAVRGGIGAMPAYGGRLDDAQIDALARYVSKAAAASR